MITESDLPAKIACETLGTSRSSYYDSKQSRIIKDDLEIKKRIERIILEFSGYGYRRVTKQLHRQGSIVNHKKVLRVMRENNLLYKRKKFRITTTDSNHNLPIYSNLAKALEVIRPNQLWVSDITYIHLPGGHVYLAVIIDFYSRKCIGL